VGRSLQRTSTLHARKIEEKSRGDRWVPDPRLRSADADRQAPRVPLILPRLQTPAMTGSTENECSVEESER
jgi:hypothetical protein